MSPLAIGLSFVRSSVMFCFSLEQVQTNDHNALLTDRFVEIPVRHIIYGASRRPHDEGTNPEETDVRQGSGKWCLDGVRSHRNRPGCVRGQLGDDVGAHGSDLLHG